MNHINYFKYVLRHKWYVFIACRRLKVNLWQSFVHDFSKFLPCEWFPYVRTFYKKDGSKQYVESAEFSYAWRHHQRVNPHHWQYWLITWDRGTTEALYMPIKYTREMVADWAGAGKAITGKWEFKEWYSKNQEKIILHPETRNDVERLINTKIY